MDQCYDGYEGWIGDGFCDDGSWGLYFNCEEFDCDGGDCLDENGECSGDSGDDGGDDGGEAEVGCSGDEDVCLSLDGGNLNYSSSADIGGFQFSHDGCVEGAGGGDAVNLGGFVVSSSGSAVIGFSFTGLRILVIILSITGSVVFYIIFNNLTKSVKLSSIGTFLILFNPLYIQYTNTFYPDVPYTILTFLSFYFLLNYINYHDSKNYLLGILFSIISIFMKQTGISILFAFAFTYLLFNKKTFNNILLTITPVFITSLFLIIYEFISLSVGTLPGYGAYSDMGNIIYRIILSPTLIDFKKIIYYTLNTTLVCGLFIFPLSTPVFYAIQKRIKFKNLRWFLTSLLLYSILILVNCQEPFVIFH